MERMEVTDIIKKIAHIKWDFADHVSRTTDSQWNSKIIGWKLQEGRRRPITCQYGDIKKVAGKLDSCCKKEEELEEQQGDPCSVWMHQGL